MPTTIGTLQSFVDAGYRVTAHCESGVNHVHYAALDLERLVLRFGPDYVISSNRTEFLALLRCSKCGGKQISLTFSPPVNLPTKAQGAAV